MGRGSKRHFKGNNKTNDRKKRKESQQEWQNQRQSNRDEYSTLPRNEKFEAFYQAQLNLNNDDWNNFMNSLSKPLPACFRINPEYPFRNELKQQLQEFAGQSQIVNGIEIAPVEQLKWYPNGDGYKLGTDRRTLRKSDELERLHKWMIQHTDSGNITRQEAVSMVPPLALNVSPNHKCLDMCAAPGSKTSQLLEVVTTSLGSEDEGIVIANDADTDRAYMLVHQCRRINSPLLMVTTHKGQEFPTIFPEFAQNSVAIRSSRASGIFDRVLCDVPCSGDGTLRKQPNIWAKWGISSAASLYPLQLQIAERGIRLVKYGGILVYSTCSMSPYEDEAVVAQLLRANKGTLELIDAREFIPNFKCRPGISSWYVLDDSKIKQKGKSKNQKSSSTNNEENDENQDNQTEDQNNNNDQENNNEEEKVEADIEEKKEEQEEKEEENGEEEVENNEGMEVIDEVNGLEKCLKLGMTHFQSFSDVPEHLQKRYQKFLFPPTPEEAEWMHLERCLRCLPQDEDTGGFFVCAMRRLPPPQYTELINQANETSTTVTTSTVINNQDEINANSESNNNSNENENNNNDDKPQSQQHQQQQPQQNTRRSGFGGPRSVVDLKQWDIESFNKLQEYFGLYRLNGKEFYIREDFTDSKQRQEYESGLRDSSNSKSIYFLPNVVQSIMNGDFYKRLKIVSAGIKVFERCAKNTFAGGGECGYRLLQEGIDVIAPYITKRIVQVPIQDFCNFVEGGLVSFSTLSPETVDKLNQITSGSVCAYYDFKQEDVLSKTSTSSEQNNHLKHRMYIVCWRGTNQTLNIMCSKLDTESLKHQLEALNVLRPKISAKDIKNQTETISETETNIHETLIDEVKDVNENNEN